MQLGVILRRVGAALLAVCAFLQLEAGISHTWHVVIVCISIFLAYLLGKEEPPKEKVGQVNI